MFSVFRIEEVFSFPNWRKKSKKPLGFFSESWKVYSVALFSIFRIEEFFSFQILKSFSFSELKSFQFSELKKEKQEAARCFLRVSEGLQWLAVPRGMNRNEMSRGGNINLWEWKTTWEVGKEVKQQMTQFRTNCLKGRFWSCGEKKSFLNTTM